MSLSYRPESFLLKSASLWVHLTNIVQAPPSIDLSILYGRQVSTYGTTPRPRMTLWLSLCLVYSLDSPGSYFHVSLGVESFHIIARCIVLVPIQASSTQYEWNIERERPRLLPQPRFPEIWNEYYVPGHTMSCTQSPLSKEIWDVAAKLK